MSADHDDPGGKSDRRSADRRKAQLPFDGPERRKGERRSGRDRRSAPRDG